MHCLPLATFGHHWWHQHTHTLLHQQSYLPSTVVVDLMVIPGRTQAKVVPVVRRTHGLAASLTVLWLFSSSLSLSPSLAR